MTPHLSLADFQAEGKLQEGNLWVHRWQFRMSRGMLNGHFSLRPQGEGTAFALMMKINQVDTGSLFRELETKQILEGKLDAEVELSGRGRSVAEWMAGLNGRTSAVMGQGRLQNKYLDLLGTDLAQSLLRLINPFRKEEDSTAFNCFVSGFEIKNGLATCSALVLDTPHMNVVGGGEINLQDEELNLSLQPSPKKGIGTEGLGKITMSLGQLAKPFKLGGTLAHPSLAIDTRRAITTIGKAVGGVVLFGPAGVLAALAGTSSGDKNPCLAAVEVAKRGGRPSAGEK